MPNLEVLHSSSGFSLDVAHIMVKASAAAYSIDPDRMREQAKSWGFERCIPFASDKSQGFMAIYDRVIVLCFCSAKSLGDWLLDADLQTVNRTYGGYDVTLHHSVVQAYESVATFISEKLCEISAGRCLWVTGHSIGGAIALLAGIELAEIVPPRGIYTFGQPKIGCSQLDAYLKEKYDDRYFRIVNDVDIVARIPNIFSHAGNMLKFDSGGRLPNDASGGFAQIWHSSKKEDELTEKEYEELITQVADLMAELGERGDTPRSNRSAGVPFIARTLERIPGIKEHDIRRYVENIKANIQANMG